jgi:hypothetical protein
LATYADSSLTELRKVVRGRNSWLYLNGI